MRNDDGTERNMDAAELARTCILCVAMALEMALYVDAVTGGRMVRSASAALDAYRRRRRVALAPINREALAGEAHAYLTWWQRRREVRGDGT